MPFCIHTEDTYPTAYMSPSVALAIGQTISGDNDIYIELAQTQEKDATMNTPIAACMIASITTAIGLIIYFLRS
jgi:hypothetical protein